MILKNVKAKESSAYQRKKKKQKTENRYTAQVKGVRDGSPSIDLT